MKNKKLITCNLFKSCKRYFKKNRVFSSSVLFLYYFSSIMFRRKTQQNSIAAHALSMTYRCMLTFLEVVCDEVQ